MEWALFVDILDLIPQPDFTQCDYQEQSEDRTRVWDRFSSTLGRTHGIGSSGRVNLQVLGRGFAGGLFSDRRSSLRSVLFRGLCLRRLLLLLLACVDFFGRLDALRVGLELVDGLNVLLVGVRIEDNAAACILGLFRQDEVHQIHGPRDLKV